MISIRIFFISIFTLAAISVIGQNVSSFEKTKGLISSKTRFGPISLLGNSSENAYIAYGLGTGTGMIKITMVKTETGLLHEYSMIKFGKEKRWPAFACMVKDKLYMIYCANTRKVSQLIYYAYEVNQQTLELAAEAKKIFDFTYMNRFEELAAINGVQASNTRDKGIIFWFSTPQITPGSFYVQTTGAYTMHFFFCNNELNLQRTTSCEVPAASEFRQEFVTPGGNLYFLFQDKVANANATTLSPFKILRFDSEGKSKTEKIEIYNQDIVDIRIILNKKNELMVAGYCLDGENAAVYNVFSAIVDTNSLALNNFKVLPLNIQGESDTNKNNAMNYYLKDILFDAAGNLFVLGEEYKQQTWVTYAPVSNRYDFGNLFVSSTTMEKTGEEHTYEYGNIIITCVPPKKFEAQSIVITKMQELSESVVSYASFIAKPFGENGVDILYNSYVDGDYSRDARYVNDKNMKKEVVYKVVHVNSTCEKGTNVFLCGMEESKAREIPENYKCKHPMTINNYHLMRDGSCILINNEEGNKKQVYIWK